MRASRIVSPVLLGGLAAAQGVPLVLEGESIPGVGLVTDVREVAVNDQASWLVLVETDHPDPLAWGPMFGNPQTPTPAAYLALSTAPAPGWPPCGVPLGSAGELLIAPDPVAVFGPALWVTPGSMAWLIVPLPLDLSLVGAKLYAQGIFADLDGLAPAEPLRLTNAYELVFGLP